MSFVAWIILGLIAGAIARAIHPGPDPGGILATIVIGIVGAFIGGLIGHAIVGRGVAGFNLWSLLLAVIGAFILLVIYRFAVTRRTGPPRPVA